MVKLDGQRLKDARKTAEALLDELELGSGPIMNSLLKAKRLARLMRDQDAITWLDLEARGYPPKFAFATLGTCVRYARQGGRLTHDNKYYYSSLPEFEADLEASKLVLKGLQFPAHIAPSVSSSNPNEETATWMASAISGVTMAYDRAVSAARNTNSQNASMFNGLKSALHNYATDCHHALSLSDAAQTLFEKARERIDNFVRIRPQGGRSDGGGIRAVRIR